MWNNPNCFINPFFMFLFLHVFGERMVHLINQFILYHLNFIAHYWYVTVTLFVCSASSQLLEISKIIKQFIYYTFISDSYNMGNNRMSHQSLCSVNPAITIGNQSVQINET